MQAISAHPFTICSSPPTNASEQSELVFYIRHRRGFTAKLYQRALEQPGVSVPVLVDGPYGGIELEKLHLADHLLVIAGGSGAGWCLPFVERCARHHSTPAENKDGHTVATDGGEGQGQYNRSGPLSLQVILATRDSSSRAWFLRAVSELLSKYSTAESSSNIRIKVYLTGEAAQHVELPSSTEKGATASSRESASSAENQITVPNEGHEGIVPGREFEGRPQLPLIVHEEANNAAEVGQSLSVFVCGPDTMQNDVRNAVAKENLDILKGSRKGGVYLHSEYFSWA